MLRSSPKTLQISVCCVYELFVATLSVVRRGSVCVWVGVSAHTHTHTRIRTHSGIQRQCVCVGVCVRVRLLITSLGTNALRV